MNLQGNDLESALAARNFFGVARSGSLIEVIDGAGEVLVRKWASSPDAVEGFRRQREKQCAFHDNQARYEGICTPRIRPEHEGGGTYFDMDYVKFLPVSEQMATWSPKSVFRFVDRLSQFIERNIVAHDVIVSTDTIREKLDQIVDRTPRRDALSKYALSIVERRRDDVPPNLRIPSGYEHGDLTFSNILASSDGDQLVLIDFTISPVETPLQDVAKLAQELTFRWSWRDRKMTSQEIARLDANLRYIKARISAGFEAAYPEALSLLAFLTIARILPYAQSSAEVAWIVDALQFIETERTG